MFSKLIQNPFVRVGIVIVSLVFLAGAALNDGWTEWFWGIPFLFLIYKLSPGGKRFRIFVVLILAVLVVGVSGWKFKSPLVYPVIGQEVTIVDPIPVMIFSSYQEDLPSYNATLIGINSGECISCSGSRYISSGKFIVREMVVSNPDFGLQYDFILENAEDRFKVTDYLLWTEIADPGEPGPFCNYVEWEYCATVKNISQYGIDAMQPQLRYLTLLMYYPVAPLMAFVYLESIVIDKLR